MIENKLNIKKERYEIAGLKILMTTYHKRTQVQAKAYISKEKWEENEADAVIDLGQEYYEHKYKTTLGNCNYDTIEYIMTGTFFNHILIEHKGAMLHSSAVVVENYGYLFSANSGTGKSTHTRLWIQHFKNKAFIINDDKPAIRKQGNDWFVYGTPWSGKTNQNVNTKVKLGAIVFIERSKNNWIKEMGVTEAIPLFFNQTIRKINSEEEMKKSLTNMEEILKENPLYKMGCNISDEAVVTAYTKIRRT